MISQIVIGLGLGLGAVFMIKAKAMHISQAGIQAIMQREAFVDHPYKDSAGILTIGYGHVIQADESFTIISPQEGYALLLNDLRPREKVVNDAVKVPLTQNMFDSLVSFVYNVGANAFENSTLLKLLNAKDYIGASNELDKWKFVTVNGQKKENDGLIARRESEQNQFWT